MTSIASSILANNNQNNKNIKEEEKHRKNKGKKGEGRKKKEEEKKKQQEAQQQLNSTSTANLGANSTSLISAANVTIVALASNTSLVTSVAVAGVRNRACDQGDQSLASGMQSNVVIGIGQQASVVTLQGLVGGNQAAFRTGLTRLNQFMSSEFVIVLFWALLKLTMLVYHVAAALNLQMMEGIADTASLAQPQLALVRIIFPRRMYMFH